MHHYSRSLVAPLFSPTVAHYYKGMLVHVPLFASELADASNEQVHEILEDRYSTETYIDVLPLDHSMAPGGYLEPTTCNDTNRLEIMVFGNQDQHLLVARYDNLGKGASGAAIQNLNLMLGLDEGVGL